MIYGPDVPFAILLVARRATRSLVLQAPRVDDVVVELLREVVADGVQIEVRRGGHGKMMIVDDGPRLSLTGNFTPVGTGLGLAEDQKASIEVAFLLEPNEAPSP